MPTRHAKNNTALGHFTKYERGLLDWGSREVRLGKDTVKKFDHCTICLKTCEDPVICPRGDLFCKECIYESLLLQKRQIKEKLREFEVDQFQSKVEEEEKQHEKEANEFLEAEKFSRSSLTNKEGDPQTSSTTTTSSAVVKSSTATTAKAQLIAKSNNPNLGCFWVPTLTPSATKDKKKLPNTKTYCPGCNQPVKTKQLTPCHLTEIVDGDADDKKAKANRQFMCPTCRDTLIDASKMCCLKRVC